VKEKGSGSVKGNAKENVFVNAARRRGSGTRSMYLIQGESSLHLEPLAIDGVLLLLGLRSLCGDLHLGVMLCIGVSMFSIALWIQ
jgi:hypothetical protein